MNGEAWTLEQVQQDLQRWQFGALLAQRAKWEGPDPLEVDAAVQSYRRRILAAALQCAGREEGLGLPPLAGDAAAWELPLVRGFLSELESLAPMGAALAPLTRFAHGQYFKYSRRVAWLLKLEEKLPCAYSPK